MITRFQRCVGIKLFSLFRWQLEIWFCPRGEIIPEHVHQCCDSQITHWIGCVEWTMNDKRRTLYTRDAGWTRSVPANVRHGAKIHSFSVFTNLERWSGTPTSAATDFVAT